MKHAIEEDSKRKREESEEKPENGLSKNKMKKLAKQARNPKKLARLAKQDLLMCSECPNLPVNHTYIISIADITVVSCIYYRGPSASTNFAERVARKSALLKVSHVKDIRE